MQFYLQSTYPEAVQGRGGGIQSLLRPKPFIHSKCLFPFTDVLRFPLVPLLRNVRAFLQHVELDH